MATKKVTEKATEAEVKVEAPVIEGTVDTTTEVPEETSDDRKSRGKDPVADETWEYRIVKSSLSGEQIQVVEENELDVPTEWFSIQEVYMDGTGAIYDHTQDLTLEAETLNDLNDMIGNITKALNLPVVDGFPVDDELDDELDGEEEGDYDDPAGYEEYEDDDEYDDDDEYYEDDDDYEYEEYDEEDPEEEYEEEPEVEEEPEPAPASEKSSPKKPTAEDNSDG